MQDLGPDIEQLMIKASGLCPLKDQDNWEEVARRLSMQAPAPPAAKQRRWKAATLLMFFLLTTAGVLFFPSEVKNPPPELSRSSNFAPKLHKLILENGTPPIEKNTDGRDEELLASKQGAINSRVRPSVQLQTRNYSEAQATTKEGTSTEDLTIPTLHGDRLIVIRTNRNSYDIAKRLLENTTSSDLRKQSIKVKNRVASETFPEPKAYYGIIVGAGMSSVNNYIGDVGFRGGFIGGYRFSNNFSVETGLIFKRNVYKARAASFNQKGIEPMLTGGRTLDEVHGTNSFLELPLQLRYEIHRPDDNIFFSAGITSAMIRKEANWYMTTMNGNNEMLYDEYDVKTFYPAAVADFSAGYERRMRAGVKLSIRPYMQLPLRGVGVGKVKVMNAGLQVAFSRPLR